MHPERCEHEDAHLVGDTATHPMAQPWGALAALLVVAGGQPAASSRLAIAHQRSTLGRVQLRFLG
ncbi:hypothetical protein H663_012805 [Limnohabitans planktonicus II-D5]|uniref:Uncharacterized protein n=1 Tax=Limnohabitans planktonicus II-D5 TaxID=1293045 RepID=A0A2T7UC93_9BURK|nr:hypothetical protein H663_012805 [Limnohabitans planktonicus II-D5]